MKTLNALLIFGFVLLFTCGTALAMSYSTSDGYTTQSDEAEQIGSEAGGTAPVPEPATMLLLGSGLVALGVGARKIKK